MHCLKTIQEKNYNVGLEIATALRDMNDYDFNQDKPTLGTSQETDKTKKEKEEKEFEKIYEKEIEKWIERKSQYRSAKSSAYATITKHYMTTSLKAKIEARKDFTSTIRDNPIKLLEVIQEYTNETDDSKYPYMTAITSIVNLLDTKQDKEESLLDYTDRLKAARDTVKSQFGDDIFHQFVKNTKEYKNEVDATKQGALLNASFDKVIACLQLRNSDKDKYGSLVTKINSDYSLGLALYPTTLKSMTEALDNHRWDAAYKKRKDN